MRSEAACWSGCTSFRTGIAVTEQIRWGIIGTGHIAKQFARGLNFLADAELLAVASRTQETAEAFAAQFRISRAYPSYADLVGDKDVDAVYVATPQNRHMADCCLCLEAGKPILCEKPFAMSAAEARHVVGLARSKRLFCMEAMWMRFFPLMQEVLALVRDGAIGEVQTLTADFGTPVKFDPADRRYRPEVGGALLERGVYTVSLASQVFGPPDGIVSTAAFGTTGVDEQVGIVLTYSAGQMALLSASLRTYTFNEAVITGSGGRIRIHEPFIRPHKTTMRKYHSSGSEASGRPDLKGRLASYAKTIPWVQRMYLRSEGFLSRGTSTRVRLFEGNGFNYEAAEVGRCLRAGAAESETMPLDETIAVMETMDAIRRQWAKVPPQEGPSSENPRDVS
jgi:predicted dehydrogenase